VHAEVHRPVGETGKDTYEQHVMPQKLWNGDTPCRRRKGETPEFIATGIQVNESGEGLQVAEDSEGLRMVGHSDHRD
jgi:hypothetical protein